jgi:hypothetical protein
MSAAGTFDGYLDPRMYTRVDLIWMSERLEKGSADE